MVASTCNSRFLKTGASSGYFLKYSKGSFICKDVVTFPASKFFLGETKEVSMESFLEKICAFKLIFSSCHKALILAFIGDSINEPCIESPLSKSDFLFSFSKETLFREYCREVSTAITAFSTEIFVLKGSEIFGIYGILKLES